MAVPVASRAGAAPAAGSSLNTGARVIAQPSTGAAPRQQANNAGSTGVVRPAPAMPSGPPPTRPVAQAASSTATKGGAKATPTKKSK
jgi:hypothetical protein